MCCPLRGKTYPNKKTRVIPITQYFGDNKSKLFYGPKGHNGVDFGVRHIRARKYDGTTAKSKAYAPILCPYNGRVVSDREIQSDTKGRYITILTDVIQIDGKLCKAKIVLFHLAYIKKRIKVGKRVKRGELVGYGGNTGLYTTGPHLHFGLKIYWKGEGNTFGKGEYIDPMRFFTSCKSPMVGRHPFKPALFWYKGEQIIKKLYLSLIK